MRDMRRAGFRQYLGLTALIGFGFFTMGLMDPLYDTYLPLFLRRYVASNALVGGIMTLDNILQLLLIPLVSIWSDRTRTSIGRRMPFIVVMLPISALLFSLIPPAAGFSFAALVGLLFVFNIFKTSVRGPVVALMPDTIPGEYRSEANGVINMMGGFGLIVSTLLLTRLIGITGLPEGFPVHGLPFILASACILIAVLILFLFVHEKIPEDEPNSEKVSVFAAVRQVFTAGRQQGDGAARGDASIPLILVSLFLWFTAYEGVKPFLGLYMVEVLGVSEGNAALAQGVAGISGVLMAVPAGYFAHKLGRRRFIRISLALLSIIMVLIPGAGVFCSRLGLGETAVLPVFLLLMFLYGAVWIGVVVNSFPMLWQMASFGTIGVFTGLYYTFSQSAAVLAPPVTGLIIDLTGHAGIFIFGAVCMIAACFTMGGVQSGEPQAGGPVAAAASNHTSNTGPS
ncbi:MAG: MFS transporter [Treponema sp.]|nr:MFS transporter [Treponema sp.]